MNVYHGHRVSFAGGQLFSNIFAAPTADGRALAREHLGDRAFFSLDAIYGITGSSR